jgi:hypothetical protein
LRVLIPWTGEIVERKTKPGQRLAFVRPPLPKDYQGKK